MTVCDACEVENAAGESFCRECGAFLDWDGAPSGSSLADRRATSNELPTQITPAEPPAPVEEPQHRRAEVGPQPQLEPTESERAEGVQAEAEAAEPLRRAETQELERQHAEAEAEAQRRDEAERRTAEELERQRAEAEAEAQRQAAIQRLIARSPALPQTETPRTPARTTAPPAAAPDTERDRAPDAPTTRPTSLEGTSAAQSTTSLASIIEIAERSGRTDLATRIKSSGEKLRRTGVELWVVGEHKKGKSSLVNALVNADVCPADPVWSTVVPIRIRGGDELTAVATDLDGTNTECELDELLITATELGNAGNTRRLRHVTVEIPRRLLGSGITLVDAPGVGGLESAVGSMTLAALGAADGALYVTDCSQELTSTELSYLRAIHERCGRAVCVMSKSDLYVDVDGIVARNRAHLDAQDLDDVPLVTVSSALHLLALAEQDPALEAESGFDVLFDVLHEHLWRPVRREQVAESGRELGDVATHLALPIAAELSASRPGVDRADQARRLEELQGRLRTMQVDTAGWQQRLNDGYQDLQGDAEHALRERLRTLARMAEARIDASGESDDLAFEAWLRKAVIDSIAEHYAMITDRASMLTEEVGGRLRSFDREDGFRPVAAAPDQHLSELHVHRSRSMTKDGFLRRIVTTGQGYTSGMVLTSSVLGAGALIGGGMVSTVFPFLALPVAGLMAKRTFGDDRDRRDLSRRTELKRLANKYLDEVGFIVQKDSRDTVRQLHRETRAHFLRRTEQLQATIAQTIAAVQRAGSDARGDAATPAEHTDELQDRRDAISGLQATATRLVLAGQTRGAA